MSICTRSIPALCILALVSPMFNAARAQTVLAPCTAIPSAPRASGQINIPSVVIGLPSTPLDTSPGAIRGLEAQFRPADALVSVPPPRAYTGAGADQVAQIVHARLLEPGVHRSAFADGPAPLDSGRWAGLYSDGETDLLILTEPAAAWPPNGVLLSPAEIGVISQLLPQKGVIVTIYAGKGIVSAVCDGRAASFMRFIAPEPKPQQATGPRGCVDLPASPNEYAAQPAAVPQAPLNLAGMTGRWPPSIQAALQAQVQGETSQVVFGPLSAFEATPYEVARRYAARLGERPGWRAAYPDGVRAVLGGGYAGLFSNGEVDALLLTYPGAEFPPAGMPLTANDRTTLRAFALNKGSPFSTVMVRYEGRGLVRAACAGRLDAVFRLE